MSIGALLERRPIMTARAKVWCALTPKRRQTAMMELASAKVRVAVLETYAMFRNDGLSDVGARMAVRVWFENHDAAEVGELADKWIKDHLERDRTKDRKPAPPKPQYPNGCVRRRI